MILSFDCETSGLPALGKPATDPAQPRLLQLGAVLHDRAWNERASISLLIVPDGWAVTQGASDTHGITTDIAARYGVRLQVALAALMDLARDAVVISAFNLAFDEMIVESELHRRNAVMGDWKRPRVRRICTMQSSSGLIGADGRWPKLAAAHEAIVGEPLTDAHDALSDAKASARILRSLIDRKAVTL